MDDLKAALAKRGRWYLFHAYVHQSSPAALRARETGVTAAPEKAPPSSPRDGAEGEDEDDSWKLYFDYLTPVPAVEPVPPEDQRVMDEYAVGRWGFASTPARIYSRRSARVMLARHLSGSMAYGPLKCSPETEREADLFLSIFTDPTARFYCNWLGPFSWSPVGVPGEGSHTFGFIMVGVQVDQIAAVANWDED